MARSQVERFKELAEMIGADESGEAVAIRKSHSRAVAKTKPAKAKRPGVQDDMPRFLSKSVKRRKA